MSVDVGGQAPRTFAPDWTFKGSALTGMQQLGQATWRAENGEIIGTPTAPDGGWLLLDKGYQDVQFAASYRCGAGCTAGVMVRSEKGADGTRGVYTLISGDERSTAAVTVDAQGKITGREPLTRSAGGQARFAPPLPAAGAAPAGGGGGRGGAGGRGGRGAAGPSGFVSMFAPPPDPAVKANDWNRVEVLVDADVFRSNVNGRGSCGRDRRHHRHLRSGCAVCRRHRRGAVQGPRDQGPRAPDHAGRADRAAVPRAAVRRLLLRLVGRGGRLQPRRRPRRDDRQPLLPRAVVHRVAGGLRRTGRTTRRRNTRRRW